MSNRQVELALISLVPTYGSDLPPSLVESAGFLLAQSRHLASTLKAEEEVARLYACAHIACDRLKLSLDLPPIDPRPPIPPRVYKRLYTHLDGILPNAAKNERRTRTPSAKARETAILSKSEGRTLPSRPTQSRDAALAQFRGKTNSKEKKNLQALDGLYPWVQPVIRHICSQSWHKRLAPSMLAGMESILMYGGRRTTDVWALENATALCAALLLFVALRVKDLMPDQALNTEILVPARKEILEQLNSAHDGVVVKGMDEEAFWEGWTDIKIEDFDEAVTQVSQRGWLDADWYNDINDVVQFDRQQSLTELDDEDSAAQIRSRRADTMLQERYDLLSETHRADYRTWKANILRRIEEKLATAETVGIP